MWLILGAEGQLGQSIQLLLKQTDTPFVAAGRNSVDIADINSCRAVFQQVKPKVVVNCAAWTAVDLAEDSVEEAHNINCNGARNVAIASREIGAKLAHISTDYVFSGVATTPYEVNAPTVPNSVYGESKLCGELAITAEYPEGSYIIRTAWLYSPFKSNFVKTMIRRALLAAPVKVVDDQIGQPTLTTDLARHIWDLVESNAPFGIFHGTNSGQTTWFELTQEIYFELGVDTSLVSPVSSSEYPTKAIRPKFSVLSHSATLESGVVAMRPWKDALQDSIFTIRDSVIQEHTKS